MKKRILSGMQATGGGRLHLGNLEGALRPWVKLQDSGDYDIFCFIADWHVLTTIGETPTDIYTASRNVAIDYLAAGLDPEKTAIFKQSDVKEHAELHLLLSMITPIGWVERIPTYKEKRELVKDNQLQVSYGLMGYPVLMSADILLYRANAVPVGKDQAAHLEISREIARRFNRIVGEEVFPIPEPLISEVNHMVMRFTFPTQKNKHKKQLIRPLPRRRNCISQIRAFQRAAVYVHYGVSMTRNITQHNGKNVEAAFAGAVSPKRKQLKLLTQALLQFGLGEQR
jgi:tryptophanyl-tRNA synthetase